LIDKTSKNFDLLALLRLGDLNIRSVAEENVSLSAKDYLDILSTFLDLALGVIETLERISTQSGNKKDFQNLSDMKHLLKSLGDNKLVPVFGAIIDAIDKGNMDFASNCAQKLSADFSKLYYRTLTATEAGKSTNLANFMNADESTSVSNGVSLKVALEQLDYKLANRKLRILVVDDAPVMLKTISAALGDEYKVYTLPNPMMVEEFLQQITPDLIILDYRMPELDGFELIPIIRNFEEHQETPIIFLTSMGTSVNVAATTMLGACDFIVKPVDRGNLRQKIAKHIVRKRLY
jgi:PleD family two-component response regulator